MASDAAGITGAELDHILTVCRIRLPADGRDRLLAEIGEILDSFAKIRDASAPAEGRSETAAVPLRPDEAAPADASVADEIRDAFPKREQGFAAVPRGL
ncbi:MAG: Asp-tRNA(Asn)/Glu-tRNA(Gln) amidotransferase subunit GatC [Methanobacteriota archaeon]